MICQKYVVEKQEYRKKQFLVLQCLLWKYRIPACAGNRKNFTQKSLKNLFFSLAFCINKIYSQKKVKYKTQEGG